MAGTQEVACLDLGASSTTDQLCDLGKGTYLSHASLSCREAKANDSNYLA